MFLYISKAEKEPQINIDMQVAPMRTVFSKEFQTYSKAVNNNKPSSKQSSQPINLRDRYQVIKNQLSSITMLWFHYWSLSYHYLWWQTYSRWILMNSLVTCLVEEIHSDREETIMSEEEVLSMDLKREVFTRQVGQECSMVAKVLDLLISTGSNSHSNSNLSWPGCHLTSSSNHQVIDLNKELQ